MSADVVSPEVVARPNAVAIGLRRARGWSQARLAVEFVEIGHRLGLVVPGKESLIKHISRVESGRTLVPGEAYVRLWCEAYGIDAAELFGQFDGPVGDDGRALFTVVSNKFIPTYLGPAAAATLAARLQMTPDVDQWHEGCLTAALACEGGSARVYLWPWNVAVVHLAEELALPSLADLAVWRRGTYPTSRTWVDEQLRTASGDVSVSSSYIFSAYWLAQPKWTGERLDTAVRLLSMPSHLLDREDEFHSDGSLLAGADLVERALLRDGGLHRQDLTSFGGQGVSIAYASWSAVAYHPIAARRALSMRELVACQLLVQGAWCYTHEVLRQVARGGDPVVPDGFGWRFLRALRSRLTNADALETGQIHSMREAIVATSKLSVQLDAALVALRESDNGR
jgi:transcriptional regulator with XRE-family HTH domain